MEIHIFIWENTFLLYYFELCDLVIDFIKRRIEYSEDSHVWLETTCLIIFIFFNAQKNNFTPGACFVQYVMQGCSQKEKIIHGMKNKPWL